ncbi:MAG TPA: DUF4870 domain-containing protein [Ktedonobacterales bacterium]|nr:DUF4870 domain-containing protein [Ktedonobacterales bacterium]
MTTGTGAGGSSSAGALVTAPLRSGAVLSVWPDRLESAGITYPLSDVAWAALVNDPAALQGMPPAPAVAWRMADGRYVSATPTDPPQTWQILEALFTQRPDLRTPLPPPPPPPGYAPYPPYGYAAYAQPQRNDNQTVMAGLAHLSILFGALIVPLVLWLVNRGKAPYAAQQSKQAFFFHVAVAVVEIVVLAVGFFIIFASMSAMVASTTYVDQTASGFFVGGIFIFYGVIFAIQIVAIVFGVIGAVKAFKGEPFHYPLMGGL